MDVSCQLHALAALLPVKETLWSREKSLAMTGIETRPSLCRLSCPGYYWGGMGTNSHCHVQYLITFSCIFFFFLDLRGLHVCILTKLQGVC
jgi:hypothetical protein